ncbi:hypothetical protein IL306_012876 [Fusarium sp. DS 682]|nr:hypothetical protein IL306_012876 [Fusarium sp. DS 682]
MDSHAGRDHGGDYDYDAPSDDEDDSEDFSDDHDESEVGDYEAPSDDEDDWEGPGGYHSHIKDNGYKGPIDLHRHLKDDGDEAPSDCHNHGEQNPAEHSAEQSGDIDFFPLEEDKELKLSILFVAVIQMAELQLLVCYNPEEASYSLEEGPVDWISVSTVAEGLAPEGLRGLYTPEACCKLFESLEASDFRQKALLACNWERLRVTVCFDDKHSEMISPSSPEDKDSGTCGRCLVFTHGLSLHEPSCVGRCQTCQRSHSNVTSAGGSQKISICMPSSVVVDAKLASLIRCLAQKDWGLGNARTVPTQMNAPISRTTRRGPASNVCKLYPT